VLEFAGLGPTPFAAMVLADLGASVIRIERPVPAEKIVGSPELDTLNRGRGAIVLDLKQLDGREAALELAAHADVVLEGFRPGVMERLGLGPDEVCDRQPRLIYARMTGWGQKGPLAAAAGHDINYLGMTGALLAMGREGEPPPPPLNLIGDVGGGGMLVVVGILAALLERMSSGIGQVVDAAMLDGAALLLAQVSSWRAMNHWSANRSDNLLDGAAYFYRCYECADAGFVAVGALERQFHDNLIRGLGLEPEAFPNRLERSCWPERGAQLAAEFRKRDRDAWSKHFEKLDACVTPVLSLDEAPLHPANREHGLHLAAVPAAPPSPAPRFSRTPVEATAAPRDPNARGVETLRAWGIDDQLVARITSSAGSA
jgi:alpha-methylacyl-CoA racemase